jgi:hypothetical protein
MSTTAIKTSTNTPIKFTPYVVDKTHEYFRRIKTIKTMFSGRVDECSVVDRTSNIWNNITLNFLESVKMTPTINFNNTTSTKSNSSVLNYKFVKHPNLISGNESNYDNKDTMKNDCFFKNLRFESPDMIDFVDSVEFFIGTELIEKIYSDQFEVVRHINNITDQSIIPFYFCKDPSKLAFINHLELKVKITLKEIKKKKDSNKKIKIKDMTLLADVYKVSPEYVNNINTNTNTSLTVSPSICMITTTTGNTLSQSFGQFDKEFNIPLQNITHTVATHLFISLSNNNELESLTLNFSTKKEIEFERKCSLNIDLTNIAKVGNYYIIPFTKSMMLEDLKQYGINLSSYEFNHSMSITVKDVPADDSMCRVFCSNINYIVSAQNMSSLRFCT